MGKLGSQLSLPRLHNKNGGILNLASAWPLTFSPVSPSGQKRTLGPLMFALSLKADIRRNAIRCPHWAKNGLMRCKMICTNESPPRGGLQFFQRICPGTTTYTRGFWFLLSPIDQFRVPILRPGVLMPPLICFVQSCFPTSRLNHQPLYFICSRVHKLGCVGPTLVLKIGLAGNSVCLKLFARPVTRVGKKSVLPAGGTLILRPRAWRVWGHVCRDPLGWPGCPNSGGRNPSASIQPSGARKQVSVER